MNEFSARNQRQAHVSHLPLAGLLFDMGDVLFDATLWRRWLLQVLHRMGVQASYRSLFAVWDYDYLDAVHCGRCEYHDAFRSFLRALGLSAGWVEEVEAASLARKRELEGSTRLFPGVQATLSRLHAQGLKLGILSDSESSSEALRARLDELGIGPYFAAIVSSREIGRTKPNAAGYCAALELMQLPAESVAFVGHDAEELAGAAALDMPTLAFNFEPGTQADVRLDRFEELLAVCSASASERGAATLAN